MILHRWSISSWNTEQSSPVPRAFLPAVSSSAERVSLRSSEEEWRQECPHYGIWYLLGIPARSFPESRQWIAEGFQGRVGAEMPPLRDPVLRAFLPSVFLSPDNRLPRGSKARSGAEMPPLRDPGTRAFLPAVTAGNPTPPPPTGGRRHRGGPGPGAHGRRPGGRAGGRG